MKWFNFFKNLFLSDSIFFNGILGAFKYLASTFYLFVKKDFCVLLLRLEKKVTIP